MRKRRRRQVLVETAEQPAVEAKNEQPEWGGVEAENKSVKVDPPKAPGTMVLGTDPACRGCLIAAFGLVANMRGESVWSLTPEEADQLATECSPAWRKYLGTWTAHNDEIRALLALGVVIQAKYVAAETMRRAKTEKPASVFAIHGGAASDHRDPGQEALRQNEPDAAHDVR